MSGPPADLAVYNAASEKCQWQSPSTKAFVTCLRSQGLDIADPASGPITAPTMQPFAPETARAAWQGCRDAFVKATGMPGDRVDEILAFPDCMAGQGWIVVVMTGPPTNQTGYAAASQNCGQTRG
jgi:hypothetical protein